MQRAGFRWEPDPPDPQYLRSPHGLFDKNTPEELIRFRRNSGYGVALQVDVVRTAHEQFTTITEHERYLATLSTSQLAAYKQALDGNASSDHGCVSKARAATGGIDLDDGDELGAAYGKAIRAMWDSSEYDALQRRVAACMRRHGEEVTSLADADADLVKRLVDLVGGTIEPDEDGQFTYEIGGPATHPYRTEDLRALRADEFARAEVEIDYWADATPEIEELWQRHSAPVIAEYPEEITELRRALTR